MQMLPMHVARNFPKKGRSVVTSGVARKFFIGGDEGAVNFMEGGGHTFWPNFSFDCTMHVTLLIWPELSTFRD